MIPKGNYLGGLLALGLAACGSPEPTEYSFALPDGFPEPTIPADNPMYVEKVELGRWLFYDPQLSLNQTQSCGSCHEAHLGFADGKAQAEGSTGEITPRGSMAIVNVAYNSAHTWANPLIKTLEEQALGPLFGEEPVELGFAAKEDELLMRLEANDRYQELFAVAFPEDTDPISVGNLTKAISAFERTMISGNSPYDRFTHKADQSAMSESAQRGMELFFSERLECFHCHGGFNFASSVTHAGIAFDETTFANTGLYNVDGMGAYPSENQGVFSVTQKPEDMGHFRAPSLRNIALTAPYMHDGSKKTLDEVIEHYSKGGTEIEDGPKAGDGRKNPLKSAFVSGFRMTLPEREDLKAFLNALTDDEFINNPAFADPFKQN